MATAAERFWIKVDKSASGGCWLWTAARYPNGYGLFMPGGKPRRSALAHRWSYEATVGIPPAGLDLDHLCRIRHCVNPAHLEPVTRSTNLRRSPLMGLSQLVKTHCPVGHPYDSVNTYSYKGRRACRLCRSAWKRQRRAATA